MLCDHFSFGFCSFLPPDFNTFLLLLYDVFLRLFQNSYICHVLHFLFLLVYVGEFFEIL